jgi:3-hydroxyisobutyrate dehydrogenase
VVVTMLADDAASDAAHRGPDGMFAASGGARWILEMGTMSQRHIAALRVDAPDGVDVIDAPVSGATQAAEAAELMIMVGAAPVKALVPVFDAMGRRTIWLGTPGTGSVMKLADNSLIHGLNQTVGGDGPDECGRYRAGCGLRRHRGLRRNRSGCCAIAGRSIWMRPPMR